MDHLDDRVDTFLRQLTARLSALARGESPEPLPGIEGVYGRLLNHRGSLDNKVLINDTQPAVAFTWHFGCDGLTMVGSSATFWEMLTHLGIDRRNIENKIFASGERPVMLLLCPTSASLERIERCADDLPSTSETTDADLLTVVPATWAAVKSIVKSHYPEVSGAILLHIDAFIRGKKQSLLKNMFAGTFAFACSCLLASYIVVMVHAALLCR